MYIWIRNADMPPRNVNYSAHVNRDLLLMYSRVTDIEDHANSPYTYEMYSESEGYAYYMIRYDLLYKIKI